jgi:peptidoglycan hydrolase CwlO-like protein
VGCAAYWLDQVSKLESEAEQLHTDFMQSQQNVKALERRLAGMETELVEQQQRVRAATVAVTLSF